jgi:hypothetical protein
LRPTPGFAGTLECRRGLGVVSPLKEPEEQLDGQRLVRAFARLNPTAFGVSVGVVAGLAVFLLTAIVLLRGPLGTGVETGPHLGLLAYYFPGYRVSWGGALVGLSWGALDGFVAGALLAWAVNAHHAFYLRLFERRQRAQGLLDG